MFTCAGRKVALVESFRAALRRSGIPGQIIGVDATTMSATLDISDYRYVVPRADAPDYIPTLMGICARHNVHLVIPLIDSDLYTLALHKDDFAAQGTTVLVSDPDVIGLCRDKYATYEFFTRHSIPTVNTYTPSDLPSQLPSFPLFVKPRRGSGSKFASSVQDQSELERALLVSPDPIIQEHAKGDEYTLDALLNLQGDVINVVPRQRLEVRAGEISKGVTRYHPRLIQQTVDLLRALQAVGPVTVQCFVDEETIQFTEINARFGGGVPLTINAGADYPAMIVAMALGKTVTPCIGSFERDMYMLRYEEARFVSAARLSEIPEGSIVRPG